MRIELNYDYESGQWRVSSSSRHYRDCYAGDLQQTIAQVIMDYSGLAMSVATSVAPKPIASEKPE